MTRNDDVQEARSRVAEADRLFAEMHPGNGPGHAPRVGDCGPQCHRIAHLRQTALVFATLALGGQGPSQTAPE